MTFHAEEYEHTSPVGDVTRARVVTHSGWIVRDCMSIDQAEALAASLNARAEAAEDEAATRTLGSDGEWIYG